MISHRSVLQFDSAIRNRTAALRLLCPPRPSVFWGQYQEKGCPEERPLTAAKVIAFFVAGVATNGAVYLGSVSFGEIRLNGLGYWLALETIVG